MKKLVLIVLIILLVIVGGAFAYLKLMLPDVGPPPKITLNKSSQQIERGRYLANHVSVCMDCHSTRDWSKFSGPLVPGTLGKGGEKFDQDMGFPGVFYSANITPTGIGNWTDGEIFRAITAGVNKNGKALFPVMPHHLYGQLDSSDIKAIIAYLHTLEPQNSQIPESEADFPMSLIINTIPAKPHFQQIPSRSDTVLYGKYLTTAAACSECHTPSKNGKPLKGKYFAGGMEFKLPSGTLRSANLTPSKKSGIGNWSRTAFIKRFKMYEKADSIQLKIPDSGFQTIMPWTMYSGMTEEDLGAIYAYLKTIDPVENKVAHFSKAVK